MRRLRLDSGLTIVAAPADEAGHVAVQAWVRAGAVDERAGEHGAAHMLEHVLFKGTAKYGVGEIARVIEGAGGEINAWTGHDQTVFQVIVPAARLDVALDVLAETLWSPRFDAAELEKERGVLLEEIAQGGDDPERLLVRELLGLTFPGHGYGRPVAGTADGVRALGRDAVVGFWRRHYRPDRVTLVIAGGVPAEAAVAAAATRFADAGAASGAAGPLERPAPPPAAGPVAEVLVRGVRTAQVAVAFRIPGLRHEDAAALDAAAALLGQGPTSRLPLGASVPAGERVLTEVTAYTWTPVGDGLFVVRARVAEGVPADRAVRLIVAEVLALGVAAPTRDEVERARARVAAAALWQRETPDGLARQIGWFSTIAGDAAYHADYLARVQALTPAAIQEAARRWLVPGRLAVAVLAPEASGAGLDDHLQKKVLRAVAEEERRARAKAEAAPAARRIESRRLPSGVRVVVERDPRLPVVAIRAAWAGGQRFEDARTAGIHRLLAGALASGCGQLSGDEIAAEMDLLGGTLSGFSGRSSFGLSAEVLAARAPRALELVAACLTDPQFPEDELARERRATEDARRVRAADPGAIAFRMLDQRLWQKHPYRLDPLGSAQGLAALDAPAVRRFYETHYRREDLVIAVVGDVEPEEIFATVDELLPAGGAGGGGAAPAAPPREVPAPQAAPREAYHFAPLEQAHFVIGYPGAALGDPDRHAVELLAAILGGQGGRLFDALREKRGLAYHVSAFSFEGMEPGYLAVHVICSPKHLPQVRAIVDAEITALRDQPPGKDELARARAWLAGTHAHALERRADRAAALALGEVYGLGWQAAARYAEDLAAVDEAAVHAAARKHLAEGLAVVSVVQPPDLTPAAAERAKGKKMKAPKPKPAKKPAAPKKPKS